MPAKLSIEIPGEVVRREVSFHSLLDASQWRNDFQSSASGYQVYVQLETSPRLPRPKNNPPSVADVIREIDFPSKPWLRTF
jgi:hypothetical protein